MMSLKTYLNNRQQTNKLHSLYEKYREHTMIPKHDFIDCLKLVSEYKNIGGSIVECGVWKGGMIAGIAEVMGKERDYYLFDSFEGLPVAKEIDGEAALAWQKNVNSPVYFDNCKAEVDWAEKVMKKTGVPHYKLVKGWFDKTIPGYTFEKPIVVLHLDADWYDSTMICLEHFFSKVAKGGIIILDDYYTWDGCSKAVHDYLSKNKRPEKIDKAYFGGCYIIKQ